jgi:hypothetical protein
MYEVEKFGKAFASKFLGTGPSSYGKRIYRVTVSQRLRNSERANINFGCPYVQRYTEFGGRRMLFFYFLSFSAT